VELSKILKVLYKGLKIKKYSLQAILRWLTILSIIVFTVLFLIPTQDLPEQSIFKWWDKSQHSLVFMALTTVAFLAYPKSNLITSIYLLIYGGFIEVLQAMTSWRQGDFYDWLADAFGVLIIYLVLETCIKIYPRSIEKLTRK
jgi:VanZ family protein